MGPQGDTVEKLKHYIDIVMKCVGLDYELVDEESDVYKQTIDVMVNGEEVCSAAVGPHVLDPAHDVHEPWCGAGFGLERLIMMRDGDGSVKKTGRSLNYLNGFKIN
jgi:phenylalanyl-tRNA synthetase alpha chain